MKNKLGISFFIIMGVCLDFLNANPPVITYLGINPSVGQSYIQYNDVNFFDAGSAGANITWDMSSMFSSSSSTVTIVSPSSTIDGSNFPNSNLGYDFGGGFVMYYKKSTTALQLYGIKLMGTLLPYSNPEDFLRFPFTYNDSFEDTWETEFESGGSTYYRGGTTTVTADGYGTIITPNGTYDNVLRVLLHQVYRDSTNFYGTPFVTEYENIQYFWYKEGYNYQIASVFDLQADGSPYSAGGYYTSNVTGIEKISRNDINVNTYPNPAKDFITFNINAQANESCEIIIYNSVGQETNLNKKFNSMQGNNTIEMDISNLNNGINFYKIINGDNIYTGKFIVE
jgi:hypothetical protein